MVTSSETFYSSYLASDVDLDELADHKGIKPSTASLYVAQHYKSSDARRIMKKLGLNRDNLQNAYNVMIQSQLYRQKYPSVKSSELTPYIHEALGPSCRNPELATSIIRKLYFDCNK